MMFEAYGIKVSSNRVFFQGDGTTVAVPFPLRTLSSLHSPQLPLLKALIERLLQDGIEELLQVLDTTARATGEAETSNVIAERAVCKLTKDQ